MDHCDALHSVRFSIWNFDNLPKWFISIIRVYYIMDLKVPFQIADCCMQNNKLMQIIYASMRAKPIHSSFCSRFVQIEYRARYLNTNTQFTLLFKFQNICCVRIKTHTLYLHILFTFSTPVQQTNIFTHIYTCC